MDAGVHLVDLALWLLGSSASSVRCRMSRAAEDTVESDAEVEIEFASGSRALLSCSYSHDLNGKVELEGEHGWAAANINRSGWLEFYSTQALICRRQGVQSPRLSKGSIYEAQMHHFCTALLQDRPFLVPMADVIAGLTLLETCYRSAFSVIAPSGERP